MCAPGSGEHPGWQESVQSSRDMGFKKAGGYTFVTFVGDHPPYHVHIRKGKREIGRWDIENQRPMDDFRVGKRLRRALKRVGYVSEQ